MKILVYFYKNESGQGLSEYALIISLIILATFGAVRAFGIKVDDLYNFIVEKLPF